MLLGTEQQRCMLNFTRDTSDFSVASAIGSFDQTLMLRTRMSCPPCTFHAGSSNKLGNSFLPFNSLKMTESDQPLSTSQTMFQIFLSPMYNQAQALKNFTKYPKTSRVLKMNSQSLITCYTSLLSFFKNKLN